MTLLAKVRLHFDVSGWNEVEIERSSYGHSLSVIVIEIQSSKIRVRASLLRSRHLENVPKMTLLVPGLVSKCRAAHKPAGYVNA